MKINNICINCANWYLYETNRSGRNIIQEMAQHGFGECAAYEFAGYYTPSLADCRNGKFQTITEKKIIKRKQWLSKRIKP